MTGGCVQLHFNLEPPSDSPFWPKCIPVDGAMPPLHCRLAAAYAGPRPRPYLPYKLQRAMPAQGFSKTRRGPLRGSPAHCAGALRSDWASTGAGSVRYFPRVDSGLELSVPEPSYCGHSLKLLNLPTSWVPARICAGYLWQQLVFAHVIEHQFTGPCRHVIVVPIKQFSIAQAVTLSLVAKVI